MKEAGGKKKKGTNDEQILSHHVRIPTMILGRGDLDKYYTHKQTNVTVTTGKQEI